MTFSDLPLATTLSLGLLAAYFLGSIPSAVWIGKSFYGVDVREKGSKNAGTTNTIRVLGLLPGLFVLGIDVFKGWLAVYLAKFFGSSLAEMNHDYLVYYQLVMNFCCHRACTSHICTFQRRQRRCHDAGCRNRIVR